MADGENGDSAGEDSEMGDDVKEGKLLASTCCAFAPQLCDLHDPTALALSQAPHQPTRNLLASLLVEHLQDNCLLVGTLLLVPVERFQLYVLSKGRRPQMSNRHLC